MSKITRIPKPRGKFTIGIDLGGTKAAAALVDLQGKIIAETTRPTVPRDMLSQDPRRIDKALSPRDVRIHINYVVDALADATLELLEEIPARQLAGVGLASAGPMNLQLGTLDYPSNFKGWKVVPIVDLFIKALHKRGLKQAPLWAVHFQNDAMAAALGEGWTGSAKGCSTYAMITVGTGIGAGVIFNGRPAHSQGMGSEWGHTIVDCEGLMNDRDTYNLRTVEGHASGTWLIRRAHARGFKGQTAADLALAAREGDALALELFRGASEALAALMYTLSLGFHPESFVFSGGMLAIKDLFLPQAIELYRDIMKRKNPQFVAPVQVSKLGTKAGVIGAARLPWLG